MTARDDGSILIEALVATAIVAMILLATFQVSADSAARRRTLEARRYALMTARSQLAAVGFATPLAAGTTEGADDDQAWRIEIEPCGQGAASTAGRLYCIAVSVRPLQGGPSLVTLTSRRLAPLA